MNKENTSHWYGFIPNLFTSLNLVCGIIATYLALKGDIKMAVVFMLTGAFFDFIDGFAARLLKVAGDFGKELDSLADLISFGLAPGAILFYIQKLHFPQFDSVSYSLSFLQWVFLLSPLLIPVFSALRLAKFNLDIRQKSEFIGLPTPANALFFASLCYTFLYKPEHFLNHINHPIVLSLLIALFSYLLISEIPLFALKFKNFTWKDNSLRYIFILGAIASLILFSISGLSAVVLLYILLSLLRLWKNKRVE